MEAELVAGTPDVEGLCLALSERSAELRILQDEVYGVVRRRCACYDRLWRRERKKGGRAG